MKLLKAVLASLLLATAVFAAGSDETSVSTEASTTSTGALGYTGTFKNHLNSELMVSPSQIYQVQGTRTDWQLGFANQKYEAGAETKATVTELNGGVVTSFTPEFKGALTLDYGMASVKQDSTDVGDASMWALTPGAAYTTGPVVLGVAVKFSGETEDPKAGSETDNTYTQVKPAVTYVGENFEAGLVYANEVDEDASGSKQAIQYPSTITVHGRTAVTDTFAVGGIIEHRGYKNLDDTTNKDQLALKATTEFDQGSYKVEGTLGYNGAYNKNSASTNAENISTMELGVASDFRFGTNATLGGALAYEFGSDEAAGTDYKVNNLGLGIRTNFTF